MAYTVKSPAEGYNGTSAGVKFVGGIGKTDNTNAADWLKRHGYEVTEEKPAAQPEASQPETPEPEASQPETPEPEVPQPPKEKASDGTKKTDGKKGGKT